MSNTWGSQETTGKIGIIYMRRSDKHFLKYVCCIPCKIVNIAWKLLNKQQKWAWFKFRGVRNEAQKCSAMSTQFLNASIWRNIN